MRFFRASTWFFATLKQISIFIFVLTISQYFPTLVARNFKHSFVTLLHALFIKASRYLFLEAVKNVFLIGNAKLSHHG